MDRKGKIAVIGAGLMGHGIAQVFACQGYSVAVTDVDEGRLGDVPRRIRSNLELMAENGIGRPHDIEAALLRVTTSGEMAEAVAGAGLVVEAVSEDPALKRRIFRELDALCPPETVLATNTSVISITEIASESKRRERVVGTHFWNPAHLIPLVEVVPGEETSVGTMDIAFDLLRSVGKHPVRVKRDVPGFVGNRLQQALWREAISIVEHGIADAATVDECVRFGFGLRLPQLGPLENSDMVGTDLTLAIHDYLLKHLEDSGQPSPLLRRKVEQGCLGFKSGKGFQDWSPERVERSRKGLQEYLLRALRQHGPQEP